MTTIYEDQTAAFELLSRAEADQAEVERMGREILALEEERLLLAGHAVQRATEAKEQLTGLSEQYETRVEKLKTETLKEKRKWKWWHIFTTPARWIWKQLKAAYSWTKRNWRGILGGITTAGVIAGAMSGVVPVGTMAAKLLDYTVKASAVVKQSQLALAV